MEWNNSSKIYPKATCKLEDEIFCISDGEEVGLAMWINLHKEFPEQGHDCDEYDFKCLGPYIEQKFWIGPINKIYLDQTEYITE